MYIINSYYVIKFIIYIINIYYIINMLLIYVICVIYCIAYYVCYKSTYIHETIKPVRIPGFIVQRDLQADKALSPHE